MIPLAPRWTSSMATSGQRMCAASKASAHASGSGNSLSAMRNREIAPRAAHSASSALTRSSRSAIRSDMTSRSHGPRGESSSRTPKGAIGPGCSGGTAGAAPYAGRAPQSGRSPFPCSLPKAFRQSAALSRRSVRLSQSLPFQPHGSGFVLNTRDLRPVAKLHEDHVAHIRPLKSGKPVRPALVSQ